MNKRPLDPHSSRQESDPSLRRVFLIFLRYSSPIILVGLTGIALMIRLSLGHFSRWDLAIVALLFAAQPFVEWLIHVFILHFKPKTILGVKLDLHAARLHRAHHRAPWQLSLIFIPKLTGAIGLTLAAASWWMLLPNPYLFATAMLGTLAFALGYEWIHYLTHTNYRPRGAYYRKLWRYHRLHHFKNEHYWMGVTGHLGDRLLGTLPADPAKVETSATSRTLGVDPA